MSLQARIIKAFTRRTVKRNNLNEQQFVRHFRHVTNNSPSLNLIPRGIRLRQINTSAFEGECMSTEHPEVTVLYIHGGAYVGGITKTYHNIASRLAKKLNGEVFLVKYPFAPEHPYPAAVNRVLEAYQYLLNEGRKPENIIISGDSAGGGLTLATLLNIRDQNLPGPRCAVALSPGASCFPDEAELRRLDKSDAMLSADMIKTAIEVYVPNKEDRSHPYASPALGDYTGISPLMILTSTEEVLYGDAKRVREAAEKSGVEVEWIERKGVFHVWPIMVPFLPEANQDLKRIVSFIRSHA
ncbi:MAG: alpha/beta hydrolase [Alcanivoracaceae bacterium]|nr:alpha/beta hydrolase [Alcanivoracaceae bacterium]